jgi:transcriptional regulator with GAF, ATPase, and Fis domain
VFLDEIGEMSAVMQVKLLRVLQERRFRRVGGLEEMQADIRVIAATNQDLTRLISEGRFARISSTASTSFRFRLPPLRERREDIPLLGGALSREIQRADGERDRRHLAPGAGAASTIRLAGQHPELENVMERAVALEPTPTSFPTVCPR